MLSDFAAGGYRYIPAVFQYSAGVTALPGFRIVRVRFNALVPLADGFARIDAYLTAAGRPRTAFCACELRSPKPFTEDGFRAFNQAYVVPLREWGIVTGDRNPLARSNVCPAIDPPAEPSFYAFSFTVPDADARPSFVVAGCAEAAEGGATYHVIAAGDTSPAGMREKAAFVLGDLENRLSALGTSWADATATHVYSVQDIHPFFADGIVRRGAARAGITWHYARPPVAGLEYEMDCRGVADERVIA